MLDLYKELQILARRLAEEELEYRLCGALAMAVYGVARATVDIDLLIRPEALGAFGAVAHDLGYVFEAEPMRFAEGAVEIRRFSKIDPEGGDVLTLDLLLVTPALEKVWPKERPVKWEGVELSVVTPEGLIELKQLRGSGQDRQDISRLKALEEVDD